jgi:hypothetical protein
LRGFAARSADGVGFWQQAAQAAADRGRPALAVARESGRAFAEAGSADLSAADEPCDSISPLAGSIAVARFPSARSDAARCLSTDASRSAINRAAGAVWSTAVAAGTVTSFAAATTAASRWSSSCKLRLVADDVAREPTRRQRTGTSNAATQAAGYAADDTARQVFVPCTGPADLRRADLAISATAAVASRAIPRAAAAGNRGAAGDARAGRRANSTRRAAVGDRAAGADTVAP